MQQVLEVLSTLAKANAESLAAAAATSKKEADDLHRRKLGELDKQARQREAAEAALTGRDETTSSSKEIRTMFDSSPIAIDGHNDTVDESFWKPVLPASQLYAAGDPGTNDEFDDQVRAYAQAGLSKLGLSMFDQSTPARPGSTDARNVPPRDKPAGAPMVPVPKRTYTPLEAYLEGRKTYESQSPFASRGADTPVPSHKEGLVFGHVDNSHLVRAAVDAAKAKMRASMDGARPAVTVGVRFVHNQIFQIDHHSLTKFAEKCIAHDSVPANDRVNPGKYIEPTMNRRMSDRLRALTSQTLTQIRLDYGLGSFTCPTEEELTKMEFPEWYRCALMSLIAVNKREAEATWRSAFDSLSHAWGFPINAALTPANIEGWEGMMNAKAKLILGMFHEGMGQFSMERNADGSQKECRSFPGTKPNNDLKTVGFYNVFFGGVGFPPQVRGADGHFLPPDPSQPNMRHAIMEDLYASAVKHPDFPIPGANAAFDLGRIMACLEKFHMLRRASASFVATYQVGAQGMTGVPMMHQALTQAHQPVQAAPPPKTVPTSPPDQPPGMTENQYSRRRSDVEQQQALSQGVVPPWFASKMQGMQSAPKQTPARRFSDGNAPQPRRQGLHLMHELALIEDEREQQERDYAQQERLAQAREYYADLLDQQERANGTGAYAQHAAAGDDGEGYITADEGPRSQQSSRRALHQLRQSVVYDEEEHEDPHRLDLLAILADMPLQQTRTFPAPVRDRIETFRSNVLERDRNRNEAPQWQPPRTSRDNNPGKLSEPPRKVSFGNGAPKGACNQHLKGTCPKDGSSCFWSHDWDVCVAEAEKIAENMAKLRALRAQGAVVAAASTNNRPQKMQDHAEHYAGSPSEGNQEE